MATPVVLTTGARPIVPVESGGVPMTPVDTLGEPVTVVDTRGEPVVLINEDGTPAFLAYSAKTYLGGVAPYHWLDFIANRALYAGADVGNVTGATGYSFTRASQGYYQNADGTLTLFGYNLLLQSQTFDNASWTKQRATITANATTAPDGTLTADKLVEDNTASNNHRTFQSVSTTGQAYAFTVFAKASERNWMYLRVDRAGPSTPAAWFDLSAGTVGTVNTGLTAAIEALANGWYRCRIVVDTADTANNSILIGLATGDNVINYTGDNTSGIFLWGAQLEPSASVGTYVPTTSAAAGALRRGDRGVLIEGSRTNLLTYSQQFDNASWNKTASASISANASTAPDGTLTADRVTFTAPASTDSVGQNATVAAGAYTASVFLKYVNTQWVQLFYGSAQFSGGAANFDLINGVVGPTVTGTASITALGNGWYRCSLTRTSAGAGTVLVCQTVPVSAGTATRFGSEIAGSYDIWQADFEAGAFPSSPIVTVAASATRAADSLVYTAGVSYPASLWCEFERPQLAGGSDYLPSLYNTGANTFLMFLTSAGLLRTVVDAASVRQADFTIASPSATANTVHKAAARVATDNVRSVLNATLSAADTSATLPAAPTIYEISASPLFGYIRRAAVFNSALTDAQLTASTT